MSAVATLPEQIALLQAFLANNRFLPTPPPALMMCGDGDFRAIGAEFLGHFVHHGGLAPNERVLDIGCGVGRMAVPLTQYLADTGSYTGVDVANEGIAWCQTVITPAYPNFSFQHLDIAHELYNPTGTLCADTVRFPFPDESFDLIFLVSVLTHLGTTALTHYASEISRLLAPGGRCFATAFLLNEPAREALAYGEGPLRFDAWDMEPEIYADPAAPLAAVAYDEDYFVEKFLRFGLHRQRPPIYGRWSGRLSEVFQDINVFDRVSQ